MVIYHLPIFVLVIIIIKRTVIAILFILPSLAPIGCCLLSMLVAVCVVFDLHWVWQSWRLVEEYECHPLFDSIFPFLDGYKDAFDGHDLL